MEYLNDVRESAAPPSEKIQTPTDKTWGYIKDRQKQKRKKKRKLRTQQESALLKSFSVNLIQIVLEDRIHIPSVIVIPESFGLIIFNLLMAL